MSFFRLINDTEYDKATVKDTDFMQFYPSVSANMKWKSLLPYADQAEKCYILPYISSAYYQDLSLKYNNLPVAGVLKLCTPANSESFVTEIPVEAQVFYYLRCASAYYTIYDAMPHINIIIGDKGIHEPAVENMAGVRQWAFKNTRWDALLKGYQFLDKAIELMEEEIDDAPDTAFPKYKNSDAYSVSKELIIPTAKTLSQFINIKNSRRAYMSFRPFIRNAETLYIRPLLGSDYYLELKTALKSFDTQTTETKAAINALLPHLQAYLAQCAIVEATPELNLYNDGDGWKVLESTDGMSMTKEAAANKIQHLISKAEGNMTYFRAELEGFIYENLDDYPTFKADASANKDHEDNQEDETDTEDDTLCGAAFF